jgi:hypothetical protein
MSAERLLLSGLTVLVVAGTLRADPPLPLDLIPEDACIGIAIRDLTELRARSDKLFGKIPMGNVPLRPSQLIDEGIKFLNLSWKIDEKKPSAIVCMTGVLAGLKADADPMGNGGFTIGAVFAPQSLEDAAKSYKIDAADLKKGKVVKVPGREFDQTFGTSQIVLRDGHIFLTGREKATDAWSKARSLRAGQTEARRKRLDTADGIVYFGPPLLRLDQKNRKPDDVDPQLGPQEADAQRSLNRAYLEVRHVLAGYRVDDGFGLDLGVGFDPAGKHSQAVLKAITGAGRTSNLNGLPDSERLIGAGAAIGLDRADLHLARVLASDLWSGLRGSSPVLSSDAALVRRIFGDFYSRLKLGRAAVYQSSDQAKYGQIGAVLIVEPVNPGQFLSEITQYVRLGDVEQFDPKGQASKAEIEKLVAELGSEDFETRESASTKLGLVGVDALSYLASAEKSDDAEVKRRAQDLRMAIDEGAALRKKELAEGLVNKAFRPTFTLKLNAEKRADANVHLLGVKIEAKDAPFPTALKDLFGPEWNRVRIAVVNKHVIFLIGSDLSLLDEAIANVRAGKPGLEASAALATFRKNAAPERRMELHLALGRVQALVTPADMLPKDFKPTGSCSSISVRTGLTDLGLDVWMPAEALEDVMRWFRL